MLADLKNIWRLNGFHARIILSLLYTEKRIFFKLPLKILRKLIIQALYHCEIHPDSFVTAHAIATLRLPHPFLLIIHRTAKVYDNCTIFHNVTVGVLEGKEIEPEAAVIKSGVYIGAKATILGNIILNEDVKIGAGAIVLKTVEGNRTVTGVYK